MVIHISQGPTTKKKKHHRIFPPSPSPQAMKKLTFTDSLVATQMHSKEGEIIDFVPGPVGMRRVRFVFVRDLHRTAVVSVFLFGCEDDEGGSWDVLGMFLAILCENPRWIQCRQRTRTWKPGWPPGCPGGVLGTSSRLVTLTGKP